MHWKLFIHLVMAK